MLAAEHRKLVAQHQKLNLLGLCRPTAEQDQLEAAAQRQVDERPNHTDLRQGRREARTHRSPPSSRTCWSRPRPTSGTPRAYFTTAPKPEFPLNALAPLFTRENADAP